MVKIILENNIYGNIELRYQFNINNIHLFYSSLMSDSDRNAMSEEDEEVVASDYSEPEIEN